MVAKGILLWTERPMLLPRERETHDWLLLSRPWHELDLVLVHDAQPGGWVHYSKTFAEAWTWAHRRSLPVVNIESDIVPTMGAFRDLLGCSEAFCTAAYEVREYRGDDAHLGASGTVDPTGKSVTHAKPGEMWMPGACDLGLVRFSAALVRELSPERFPVLAGPAELLHVQLFDRLRDVHPGLRVHVHPTLGVRNAHAEWDAGDWDHHR